MRKAGIDRLSEHRSLRVPLAQRRADGSLVAVVAVLIIILASAIPSIQAAQEQGTSPNSASNDWSAQAQQAIAAANWSIDGDQASGNLGWSVGAAGDVNGDGYADALVAAPWYDNGYPMSGRVYLFYGSATGLTTAPAWVANGNTTNCCLGRCVTTAGDINNDGYSDILISDGYYVWGDDASGTRGHVYVFYGSASGLKANATPANADLTLQGVQAKEMFGFSCASAGDINKDGFSDIIVGAPFYNTTLTRAGQAYVFYGSATGLTTSPAWMIQGTQANARFAWSVASAGDVNGDGYPDIVIGANYYNVTGKPQAGRVYVHYGSASGLSTTPDKIYDGDQAYAYLGWSVACAGDVNKDGYSDIITSEYYYDDTGLPNTGRLMAYYGSASGLPITPSWTLTNSQYDAHLGNCISSGDFNGDGYSDVVAGAYGYNSYVGEAFTFNGSPSGLPTTGVVITVPTSSDAEFGWALAGVGDVNRDGASDLLIGAFAAYPNAKLSAGRAYAYYGTSPANPSEILEIVSVTQTPDKKVDIIYNLTPADPAPANGYDIATLAMETALDCAATSATPDSAFDDITDYVTGSTHITSGSGLLTWNVQGMPAGALKSKYWKAGVSVLFRLKATPTP